MRSLTLVFADEMEFRRHARQRMTKRQITAAEVAEVLANPSTTYPSTQPGDEPRTVVIGETGNGRRLKVVVVTASPETVVTIADRGEEE